MSKEGVIVIGGHVQGLGIIRSLGSKGIPVILIDSEALSLGMFSRFTNKVFCSPKLSSSNSFVKFLIHLSIKLRVGKFIQPMIEH